METNRLINRVDDIAISQLGGELLLIVAVLGNWSVRQEIDRELKRRTRRIFRRLPTEQTTRRCAFALAVAA